MGEDNISTMFICRTSSTAAGWAGQRIWRWSSGSSGWKRKKLLHDPFVAALFIYCGASLLQFRGGDTLAFLLLGMYLAYRDADDKKENLVVKIPLGKGKETL